MSFHLAADDDEDRDWELRRTLGYDFSCPRCGTENRLPGDEDDPHPRERKCQGPMCGRSYYPEQIREPLCGASKSKTKMTCQMVQGHPGPHGGYSQSNRNPGWQTWASLQAEAVTFETYRGVKIKVKPGKGDTWGMTHAEVNGHNLGPHMGDEDRTLSWIRGTVDDAIERPEAYDDHWQPGHKGVKDPTAWQGHRCAAKVATDQIKVPEKVDTMREEICPVCGSDDSYVGDKCTVCGFEKPPSIFMDPDTSLAQNVDLRQEDQEQANDDGLGDLQCPNCGETFPSAEALNAQGTPHLAPAGQTIPAEEDLEVPEVPEGAPEADQDEEAEPDNQMAPPPPGGPEGPPEDVEDQGPPEEEEGEGPEPPGPGRDTEEPEPLDEELPEDAAAEPDEEEIPGSEAEQTEDQEEEPLLAPGQQEPEPEPTSPEEAAEEQYATDQAAMAQTGYEEGDICPNCGQGLLEPAGETPMPGAPPQVSEQVPQGGPPVAPGQAGDESDEEAEEDESAPEADEDDQAAEEQAEENAEEEDQDQEPESDADDDEEEEDEDGEGPPWLKKKTSSYELPIGRNVSTMPNRPRRPVTAQNSPDNERVSTPRSSVRTALHSALNRQAQVIRTMSAACHQERLMRLAAEARISTLERQMLRFAQLAGADTDNELRAINAEGYQTHQALLAKAAALQVVADERDPAQPVPEGAPEPPVVTEQQAAQPAARDDVTQLGASPVTDVSADATVAVDQPYGTEAFEPLNLNEVDVTAPVQNTQGHLPPEQTIIPVEVRVGDPDNPQPSFGWTLDGAGAPQGQTGGSVGSGAPVAGGGNRQAQASRLPSQDGQVSLGALRLARLRIQAGIAPPGADDITIAASIQDNPDMTVEAVNTEIKTLTQVLSVPQPGRTATANRRLVPRAANPEQSGPVSLAPSGEGPIRAHASTGAVNDDEILFE